MNDYELAYKLESEKGVKAFLRDITKLSEARFYARDLSISDILVDFEIAMNNCLTVRQREVIDLLFFKDMRQVDVANGLNVSQQTIQEHKVKAIKSLATYHMLQKQRDKEAI